MTPENIILYPRSYNKRGDESLHSVQGVTAQGEEVNVKLRIPSNAKILGAKPSISEFARDDYGAKNVCIATPDNGPNNPGGMLLFTGCEPDGENRKGLTSYIARWAHRLVADREAPAPIQGIGRIDVAEMTSKNKGILTDIKALNEAKPNGWQERVSILEAQLRNAVDFQYQLRMYRTEETRVFSLLDKEAWETHFTALIDGRKVSGGFTGVFVRIRLEGGKYLPEVASEMVPLWMTKGRYQTGAEVLDWLYRKNPELPGLGDDAQIVLVPVDCHTAGAVFRKHYGALDRYNRLRQQYYPGDRPEVCQLVASQSLHDGEPMLLRVHSLTGPLGSPTKLDENGRLTSLMVGEEMPVIPQADVAVEAGLNGFAPIAFPAWFSPIRYVIDEADIGHLPDHLRDSSCLEEHIEDVSLMDEADEMVIIDNIFELNADVESAGPMTSEPAFDGFESQRLIEPEPEPEPVLEMDIIEEQLVETDKPVQARSEDSAGFANKKLTDEAVESISLDDTYPDVSIVDAVTDDSFKSVSGLSSDAATPSTVNVEPTIPDDMEPNIESAVDEPSNPSSKPIKVEANPPKPKPKGLARFMANKGLIG